MAKELNHNSRLGLVVNVKCASKQGVRDEACTKSVNRNNEFGSKPCARSGELGSKPCAPGRDSVVDSRARIATATEVRDG